METAFRLNKKGLTLIELLVGLVICAIVVAGIYRLFIAQGKAYVVQDQVVEVQQNVRSAMEVMLRDLRMAGFDDDTTPLVTNPEPPVLPGDTSVTVRYEHGNAPYEVLYRLDAGSVLNRLETKNGVSTTETILENVDALTFSYGVDEDNDNAMDDRNGNGLADDWISAGTVGNLKIVTVRVSLTGRPAQVNPDLQSVTPRTLVSAVSLRNLSLMR